MRVMVGRLVTFAGLALLIGCESSNSVPSPAQTIDPSTPLASTAASTTLVITKTSNTVTTSATLSPMCEAALEALYAAPHREDGTVMHGSHQGAQWTKWAKPDGSMELLAGHGLFADTGKFVVRGDMVCTRWGIIDHGKEGCEHVVQVGANEYMTVGTDGVEGSKFKVLPP